MVGVLSDLIVLDLSDGIAGPMTAMLLCDQGARVIKVESPGGDPSRCLPGARVWHRGKESIELDLFSASGRKAVKALVERADVLLTSAEPAVRDRQGLSYPDLHRENPRLVYCSISAYGDVESHAGRPGRDALVAARTGLQWEKRGWPGGSIERVNRIEPFFSDIDIPPSDREGPERAGPLYSVVPWPSLSAFYLASIGISAALHVREVVGQGQLVETSLLQGALVNGLFTWQRIAETGASDYRMWVTDPRVPHGFFQSQDGHWVQNWVPQPSFAVSAQVEHLDPNAGDRESFPVSERTGMGPEELVVLREYLEPMRAAYRRFSADQWEELSARAGLSVQRIRSPEEALSTQAFLDDGCVVEVTDPELGPIRHVGVTYRLERCPVSIERGSPLPGRDTARIQQELDGPGDLSKEYKSTVEPDSSPDLARGPLTGVVVLDLGLAVAGPFGTQVLADLGADVIKVNQASDAGWANLYMGMCCNRGKRSIVVNLKSAAGLEVLQAMVRQADVVHSNMHLDSMKRLQVDYNSLKALNNRLIYCHTRGFENGPRVNLVGHDQSGSAVAGVAWEEGGMYDGGKPIWPNISLGDTGNGMLSAVAVIQALYHRDRTGQGQLVETSIAYVHLLNNSSTWIHSSGQAARRPRLDRDHLGVGPLRRLYETGDGWLCLDVQSAEEWRSLALALELPRLLIDGRFSTEGARDDHSSELAEELSAALIKRTASEWQGRFEIGGVPSEVVSTEFGRDLFDDPEMIARGLVVKHGHRRYGHVEMLGRLVDFSQTPAVIDRGPLVPGRESREILGQFGFADDDIERLVRSGAVAEAPPET